MTEGFGLAALGALYASVVAAVVAAILDTDFGQGLSEDLDADVPGLIAAPIFVMCAIVFVACVLALVLPQHRKRLLGIAGVTGWLIPAWLIFTGVIIAGVALGLNRLSD